jgi:hypothetical protein
MTPLTDRVFYDIDSAMKANPSGNFSPVFDMPHPQKIGEPISERGTYDRYEVQQFRGELFGPSAGIITFWRWVKTR